MIVLDASVLIAYLDGGDPHHARAVALLLEQLDEPLGASPVTIAEVLVGPVRAGRAAVALAALDDLAVTTVALPDDAPLRLAQLRVEHGLRLPDCCVLLAALLTGGRLATFDAGLARAAGPRAVSG